MVGKTTQGCQRTAIKELNHTTRMITSLRENSWQSIE